MEIKTAIDIYLGKLGVKERYASFDYCYGYFYSFYKNGLSKLADKEHLEKSCLQLCFYLASWGMYRASAPSFKKSIKIYEPIIKAISKMNPKYWEIDVGNYSENWELLLECKEEIKQNLDPDQKHSETLITKIMLGVFANTPAFDTNFIRSFGIKKLDEKSINQIREFYTEHQDAIDSHDIKAFDFLTGQNTGPRYTKAKIIDMYGFIDGRNKKTK